MSEVAIPEINQAQLDLLMKFALGDRRVIFFILPDAVKDRPDEFFRFTRAQTEIDELIKIGLLLDTSAEEEEAEQIRTFEAANNRQFRAISITNLGMVMFAHVLGKESKKVN